MKEGGSRRENRSGAGWCCPILAPRLLDPPRGNGRSPQPSEWSIGIDSRRKTRLPASRFSRKRVCNWFEKEGGRGGGTLALTDVILIEFVQRFQSRDRRLVYRELPGDVLARLPRGLLPLPLACLVPAWLPALRTLSGAKLARAAMIRRLLPGLAAPRTLATPSIRHGHHAAPRILPLRLWSLVERTVPGSKYFTLIVD